MRHAIARLIMLPGGLLCVILGALQSPEDSRRNELIGIGVGLVIIGLIWNMIHHWRCSASGGKGKRGRQGESTTSEFPEELIKRIPELAARHIEVVENHAGVELPLSKDGIAMLDAIIEDGWGGSKPNLNDQVVLGFGCFLGEAIRAEHGGDWAHDCATGISLRNIGGYDIKVFPFDKTAKRFANGAEDSIGFFYNFLVASVDEKEDAFRPK